MGLNGSLVRLLGFDREERKIYCDAPNCGKEIESNRVSYSKYYGDLYHLGSCTLKAVESYDSCFPSELPKNIGRRKALSLRRSN